MARYKVTNGGSLPVAMKWTKGLLNPGDRILYDEYRKSDRYLGTTEEERSKRMRLGEAINMEPFFLELARGVQVRVAERQSDGTSRYRYLYNFYSFDYISLRHSI